MAPSQRRTRAALAAGWAGLAGLHLALSAPLTGPSVVFDEAGYLGNARWLAGSSGGATWAMPTSPAYASGYSLVLAPVTALLEDPDRQWRAVLVVNAVLLATVLPLLFAVLTRVAGVARRPAFAGAMVGAVAPAVLAAGVSAIAENLVLPLVLLLVLAARAMVAPPGRRPWTRFLFGPVVAALVTTHPRFTLAVPVALAALAVADRRGLAPRLVVVANAGLLVASGAVGWLLNRAVVDGRWTRVERLEGGPAEWLDLVTSARGLRELALEAVGQAWYVAAGSIGLAVVGLLVAVRLVRGTAVDGAARRVPVGSRFGLGVLLAVAGAVFATSILFFAQNQFRADHWVYGRHNDSFTPLLLGLGVASLLTTRSWRQRLVDLVAAAALIGAAGSVVVVARDPRDLGNDVSAFAVPAIVRWARSDPAGVFARATLVGLAGALVLAVAFVAAPLVLRAAAAPVRGPVRRASTAGVVVALVGWSTWVGSAAAQVTHDFQSTSAEGWHLPEQVTDLRIGSLAVEERVAKSLPTLTYPFALPGVDVTTYSAELGEDPVGPYVVARLDDPERLDEGDRAVLLDEGGWYGFFGAPLGLAVWVRPGPVQQRLARAGRLLPATFPSALPAPALRVEVRAADGQGRWEAPPGGWVDIAVTGRHVGSGSPWPDRDSFGLDHRVQVQARPSGSSTSPAPRVATGELDRWVVPGGRFMSVVRVTAVDELGAPLPPGRYRMALGVAQAGDAGFAPGRGPGAEVEVVVR